MNNRKVIFVTSIVVVALIVSLVFNWHYYVNLRRENENVVNNMRARALAVFGSEVTTVAYFLEKYLGTKDDSIIDQEVSWGIPRAEWEAEICTQGLSADSGLIYCELEKTALKLESYLVWKYYGPLNSTKIETIAQLLKEIGNSFTGLDMLQDKDPLENLYQTDVNTIISKCRQVQDIVSNQ